MTRARTYTKSEISDAASAAAESGVRVIMHPSGEIEFAPKSFSAPKLELSGDSALEAWKRGREARGGA